MKKKIFYTALVNAFLLLMVSYVLQNIAIPFSGDETIALRRFIQRPKSHKYHDCATCLWKDSIYLINIAYDIDTVPHISASGLPDGYYAITNRRDIYKTLLALKKDSTYKYVVLDVEISKLPDGYNTYTDSIVELLTQMPRVVIANSSLADSVRLSPIAGDVNYIINPEETGFTKFPLSGSLPLKLYEDISGRKIKKRLWGLFYTDNYAPCRNVLMPTYFITQDSLICMNFFQREDGNIDTILVNLYNELQDVAEYAQYGFDVKNKIVVIGDFASNHDQHQTIVGSMSGILILLNIYKSLEYGYHKINLLLTIILFILYSVIFYSIVVGNKIWSAIPFWHNFWQSEIVQMLIGCISWSLVFGILSTVIYSSTGYIFNPFIPALWLSIIPKIYATLINNSHKK